jgi:hypothetical protein
MKTTEPTAAQRHAAISLIAVIIATATVLAGCGGNGGPPTQPTSTTPLELAFPPGKYTEVQTYGNVFTLAYTVTGDTISVGLKVKTPGWVAIAMGPAHGNSDVWIGFVNAAGQLILEDSDNASKAGDHPKDSSRGGTDDLFDFSGSESGGITTIEFKRLLNTGDSLDIPLVPGNNSITWALGQTDLLTNMHIRFGFGTITVPR